MFTLELDIDVSVLKSLKRYIACLCPDERSSLLTEAIARGLGFRTQASLLARIEQDKSVVCRGDGLLFVEYCVSNGRDIPERTFYIAMAQTAIHIIRQKFSRIGRNGYGCGRPQKIDGKWETAQEHYKRFLEGQSELDHPDIAEQFLRAIALLQIIPRIKSINDKTSSYELKHIAENLKCSYPNGERLGPDYVGNSPLIMAALHIGLEFRTYRDELGWESPNLSFNLSQKAIIDIDCVARPDGARAQDRKRKARKDPIAKLIARKIREQRKVGNRLFM